MNGKSIVNFGMIGSIVAWGVAAAIFIVLFIYLNNIMQDPLCKNIDPQKRQFLYVMCIIEFVILGISLLGAIWATVTLQGKRR